jgi:hypothetical protein
MLATGAFLPFLKRHSRPVNGPLSFDLDSVNGFLQFYFKIFERRRNLRF